MITTKIPYDFARQRVKLSWRDVQYGLEHQLIASQTAVDKAVDRSSEPGEPSQNEVDLASTAASEPVLELVGRLAAAENASADDVQAKWLYLVLAWVFESRASLSDPLATVEEVYSDFGYPREVAPFVRYMPMVGPDLGNRQHNEARRR